MNRWLPRPALIWQLIAAWAAVGPHLLWMPIWLTLLLAGASVARVQIYRGVWPFPHWSIKAAMIMLLAAGLVLSFDRSTLMSGTLSLLIGGLALKMIEIHTRRDALVLIFLGYFVIGTQFLFEQGILWSLYGVIAVALVLSSQISLFDTAQPRPFLSPLKLTGRLLLPAVPLMLVLFLVIPRIGPLWTVPLDQGRAQTGLSDQVSPGDISQLTRSGALAFRAGFDAAPPPPAQRYWRSLVYSEFDGRTWSVLPSSKTPLEKLASPAPAYRYEVVMEPSYRPWLVALDVPLSVRGAELGGARQVYLKAPVDRRTQYQVQSAPQYRLVEQLSSADQQRYTAFPRRANPQTQRLAQELWAQAGQQVNAYVERILQRYQRSFVYTLEPPRLGANSVDQFLFETQRGFCSHYASATALLLRAAGIPARLVGGYLGGEWNPEGYMTVRQYDAHAWVEYFTEEAGWVRLDPTAAVAPERVEQNSETLFADQSGFLADQPLSALRFSRSGWLFDLRQRLDAINFAWHRWVLNYQRHQTSVLNELLGGLTPLRLALALLIPGMLILGWVSFQLRPIKVRRSALEKAQARLEAELLKHQIKRAPRQPIFQWAESLSDRFPELQDVLSDLAKIDEQYRYADDTVSQERLVAAMDRVIQQLRSKRRGVKRV